MEYAIYKMKPPINMPVVKKYESFLKGEMVRVVMYRNGRRYGVVMVKGNTASTINPMDKSDRLTTFAGNEESIIEWVPIELANSHYADLVLPLLGQRTAQLNRNGEGASLKLVTKNG